MNTRIRPQKIDLSKADGYAVTDADLVINQLKQNGHYKPGLMFRGFNGEKLEIMLKYSTDNPDSELIFCGNESELIEGGMESGMNAIFYATSHTIPALAIYDGSKLTEGDSIQNKRFMDPDNKLDALIVVYLLKVK